MRRFNQLFIDLLNDVLSSTTGLYVALIIPLLVIPLPQAIKQVENILSSNWVQLWALFVLAIIAKKGQHQARVHHAEHMKALGQIAPASPNPNKPTNSKNDDGKKQKRQN